MSNGRIKKLAPFTKWLRNLFQKMRSTFYEGPEPPTRLAKVVLAFAHHNKNATRKEWIEFSIQFAEECYRSGYQRGIEWYHRDPEQSKLPVDPDILADAESHDWQWTDGIPSQDELAIDKEVPETNNEFTDMMILEEEMRARYDRERMGAKTDR